MNDSIYRAQPDCASLILRQALDWTQKGIPIFPGAIFVKEDGTKSKASHSNMKRNGKRWGHTTDPELIREYFADPTRTLLGMPTGVESGFVIIDVDTISGHGVDGDAEWEKFLNGRLLPPTRISRTPTGSRHFWFKWPGFDVVTKAGALGPGIDLKGDGGMVFLPGSMRPDGVVVWDNELPVADLPEWIRDDPRIRKAQGERRTVGTPRSAPVGHRPPADTRAAEVMALACKKVAAAEEGTRNDVLNTQAVIVGHYVGNGEIAADVAAHDLLEACDESGLLANDGERSCLATIRSGLTAGAKEPALTTSVATRQQSAQIQDFVGYGPKNVFYYLPTGQMWSAEGINNSFPKVLVSKPMEKEVRIPASTYIMRTARVECVTWYPGAPMIVEGKHYVEGGWMDAPGRTYNTFRPGPELQRGGDPRPWLWHVYFIYPEHAAYIISWLAFAVRNPGVKINHALCLFGKQRIGKDTLLLPALHAAGKWNCKETNVTEIYGGWTTHLAAVITRVNEIHDLGEGNKINRYGLYEKMKTMLAAPPESNLINGKYAVPHWAPNVCNVIIGSNHKTGGMYLPDDDQRHFVAWSPRTRETFADDYLRQTGRTLDGGAKQYFDEFYHWLHNGGIEAVAAYLRFEADISAFNPKADPPKTDAWRAIVASNKSPEDGEWSDVLERLKWPAVVTVKQIRDEASRARYDHLVTWMTNNRNSGIDHRFENNNYERIPSKAKDGRWKINGKNEVVYGRKDLTPQQHFSAIAVFSSSGP